MLNEKTGDGRRMSFRFYPLPSLSFSIQHSAFSIPPMLLPALKSLVPAPLRKAARAVAGQIRRPFKPLLHAIRDRQAPGLHRWMMHEASVPMELPRGSALVVAPHHDDETFACGGLIALKRDAGIA